MLKMSIRISALLVSASLLLIACGQGPGKKPVEPKPEPEPPAPLNPAERLIGTWKTTEYNWWVHDDESDTYVLIGRQHEVLTFTPERWISVIEGVRFDGTRGPFGGGSGTWTATDTTITQHVIHHVDDEVYELTYQKDFLFADEVLVLQNWGHTPNRDETDAGVTRFQRYQRLENTVPTIIGTWVREVPENEPDEEAASLALNADGTFIYQQTGRGRHEGYEFEHRGKWTHDDVNYYVVWSEVVSTENGEPHYDWVNVLGARLAYAPTGDGGVMLSKFWREPPAPNYEDYGPYGGYWDHYRLAE